MSQQNIKKLIKKKKKHAFTCFNEFLNNNRVMKGSAHTHTSISKGSYYISDDKKPHFYKLYAKSVFEEGNKAHLTEKHQDISPVLIDCDFKYNQDKLDRQYDLSLIINLRFFQ